MVVPNVRYEPSARGFATIIPDISLLPNFKVYDKRRGVAETPEVTAADKVSAVTTVTRESFVVTETDAAPETSEPTADAPAADDDAETPEASAAGTSETSSLGTQEAARIATLSNVKHRCRNLLIELIVCENISGIVIRILVHNQTAD